MIRLVLVFLCLLGAASPQADIYRWVDAEGRTHFSDRPPTEPGAQIVEPGAGSAGATAIPAASADEAVLGPYRTFQILAPSDGAVLSQPTDGLFVTVQLDPDLLVGHGLEVLLDGQSTLLAAGSTSLMLPSTGFGPHRLQARVRDAEGVEVARTKAHNVEILHTNPPGLLP
jgi:hypothetical protein